MAKYDILLIGDDTNLLKTLGWVLDYKGFAVQVTATPAAALEALVQKNYDLVSLPSLPWVAERAWTSCSGPGGSILKSRSWQSASIAMPPLPLEAYQIEVDDYLLMAVSPPELWRRVSRCLEDRELVDLQPVRGSAASFRTGAWSEPQMMLLAHDIRGSMVSTAASLKLMDRGIFGEMSEKAKAKLHEITDRIEKTIHLIEDFIGRSLGDRRPEALEGRMPRCDRRYCRTGPGRTGC